MRKLTLARWLTPALACAALLGAVGCEKQSAISTPEPHTLTREASGYYCLMTVVYHNGPKGQIILSDGKINWFTSVRDTIAFTLLPEEPKNIAAIYVNDMSDANWDNPGEDNWIDARSAWYVIDSKRMGGMGAPEAVPFSSQQSAQAFTQKHGGKVVAFKDIPHDYILESAE
jgi:copper chaperone NosL